MHYGSALTRLFGSGILLVVLTACQTEAPAANETAPIAASENASPPAASGDAASASEPSMTAASAAAGPVASAAAAESRAAAPRTACGLLPASEVEPIIGVAVRDSVALAIPATQHAPPVSQCNYGTLRNPAAASLMLRGLPDGQTAASASDSVRQALNRSGILLLEDVDGVGEIAFWGANQLHVFPGNGWYLIVSPEPGVGLPQARQMAERALARFP